MVEQWTNSDNLTPWKPGQSGNPKGRPDNTKSITWWYKKLLAEKDGLTAQQIAKMAIERAKAGSLPHTQEITDRTDGTLARQDAIPVGNQTINILVYDNETRELMGMVKEKTRKLLGEPEVNEEG